MRPSTNTDLIWGLLLTMVWDADNMNDEIFTEDVTYRKPLLTEADNYWLQTTIDYRQLLITDNYWWQTIIDYRQLLITDNYWLQTTID